MALRTLICDLTWISIICGIFCWSAICDCFTASSFSQQKYLDDGGFVMRVPQDILPGGQAPQFTPVQFIHEQMAPDWGVTLSSRDAAMLRQEDLFLLAAEDFNSATREEGSQRLYRTGAAEVVRAIIPISDRLSG